MKDVAAALVNTTTRGGPPVSRLVPAALGCVLLAVPACTGDKSETNFDNYKPLAEAIGKADRVVLYEGLPHQVFEAKLLETERKEKKTVEHHGFPFYSEPLELKGDDGQKLIALFTDPGSFSKLTEWKRCGGFHPDYLVEYNVGDDVYRMLVCLGCCEVKVYGPKAGLYCDICGKSKEAFEKVLKPYRKNRPEQKQP